MLKYKNPQKKENNMSAGICIMNRNAIAMAADSAVTVGDHAAIHNSANKLFSLSKVAPIGVIIYANGAFMGVPMEIIIKEYKKRIGKKTFSALKDYLDDFIHYLETHVHFFRFDINEEVFVMSVFMDLMSGLNGDYNILTGRKRDEKGSDLTEEEKESISGEALNVTIKFINDKGNIENASFVEYIKKKYKAEFMRILDTEKDFAWIKKDKIESFVDEVITIYDKKFDRNGYVGLAIAGYGDNEIYPSLMHIHLSGFIDGKIRYFVEQEVSISERIPASVVPLAQVDVMQTFLFGINDQFLGYLANEIPSQIVNSLNSMDDKLFAVGQKNAVMKQLVGVTDNVLKHMQEIAINNYMSPIFDSVATLPIEELGLLAESMINITSIRRKVALDSNIGTVGGPIDVSIISKGDGFIWLKRKHYFERKYNPQFFYSHYEDGQRGDLNDE